MEELKRNLIKIVGAMGVNFTLSGRSLALEEIFMEGGLLPAIARRADQLSSLCLGYGLGISFTESPQTTLGITVSFDKVTPNTLRYLFIIDVLYELVYHSPSKQVVALDELMYD